ncbi:uncharacterized protein CC84DRAFT_859882 [Paraphaeosphaeria sporulosa]|uniref:Uncharacterized protein n=1 Tax=Paraphaeosphaeria sporulosa TaxID=1460663 RepID=A0A177C7N5_9PLEO|nr:uncharacterized protein CC84DRAFT_859882 [Paraphaeosphaeria sporulosa]OAG03565.1 hypothetical protein CC84DRAFT_859882 [Paraphaeosphaeria sporulosa]
MIGLSSVLRCPPSTDRITAHQSHQLSKRRHQCEVSPLGPLFVLCLSVISTSRCVQHILWSSNIKYLFSASTQFFPSPRPQCCLMNAKAVYNRTCPHAT